MASNRGRSAGRKRPQTGGGTRRVGSAPGGPRGDGSIGPGSNSAYCGVEECPICRSLLQTYAASMVAGKTQISPFDRLVAQDFVPSKELSGGSRFCRFHAMNKKRFDILCFINKGLKQGIRYEALYDLLSNMDLLEAKSIDWLIGDIKENVHMKQIVTRGEVRDSLIREARRLTDLWDAQVEDLDTQIAHAINDLQRRQAQDLAFEFENIETKFAKKRPHFSSSLLALFQQEPRMCRAKAFNEALKVVDAGRQLESVQTMRFKREMEREKSLKLSWKVCQQTRQINGIVEKMQRHRRKEEANRETDRERLKSRVKTALQRLEKVQRQALVMMRQPFLQHVYRVRHLVQAHSSGKENAPGTRKPIYEEPAPASFQTRDFDDLGREVRTIMTFDECSPELFYSMIMGDNDALASLPGPDEDSDDHDKQQMTADLAAEGLSSPGKERPKSSGGGAAGESRMVSASPGGAAQYMIRPKSAPYLPSGGAVHCSWCGGFCGHPLELELEKDMPASVQRALDSTEFANVALSAPSLDSILPGPKGIPNVPALNQKSKSNSHASLTNLKTLISKDQSGADRKVVAHCCSFRCLYQWNDTNSPVYLRSRRHLQIDLMQRQRKAEVMGSVS